MMSKQRLSHADQMGALVHAFASVAGYRQADLARLLDLGQASISARMRGVTPFTVEELTALAVAFDVDVSDLIPPVVEA